MRVCISVARGSPRSCKKKGCRHVRQNIRVESKTQQWQAGTKKRTMHIFSHGFCVLACVSASFLPLWIGWYLNEFLQPTSSPNLPLPFCCNFALNSVHSQDPYPRRGLQRQQQRAGPHQDPREERHCRGAWPLPFPDTCYIVPLSPCSTSSIMNHIILSLTAQRSFYIIEAVSFSTMPVRRRTFLFFLCSTSFFYDPSTVLDSILFFEKEFSVF